MFHTHNYQEVERFYAEPRDEVNTDNLEWGKVFSFGQTTILYKCVDREIEQYGVGVSGINYTISNGCGKTYKEEILGKKI